ncbi:hypothetical protein OJAV_G00081870 [Oryzias javanicus]|uniref:Uncharacterized protein n=1 Tax=Oryzias javanicus TaxID=123683 RepID=A0A437D400_ORYJA|nr:hypothetical protein OJAV_G00081870 [Oryzias javanicus]
MADRIFSELWFLFGFYLWQLKRPYRKSIKHERQGGREGEWLREAERIEEEEEAASQQQQVFESSIRRRKK